MSQTILLIGSNGQVGKELQTVLLCYGRVISVARPVIDLLQPDTLRQVIHKYQPQLIINAAAYTAVDQAENELDLATTINAVAPGIIAAEAEKIGAGLIHISTDYVFDGYSCRPYHEDDEARPLNAYGRTKLAGEKAIQQTNARYLLLRTAWVYGTFGKSNFVKTMLRLGAEREEIRVVADQIGSPTWAKDFAEVIAQCIPRLTSGGTSGIYHYTNSGIASWYDFAVAIFEEAQQLGFPLKVRRVIPITTPEYPTPARRPRYSVLACTKIAVALGTHAPHWRQRLREMLTELYTLNFNNESSDSFRR